MLLGGDKVAIFREVYYILFVFAFGADVVSEGGVSTPQSWISSKKAYGQLGVIGR